MATEAEPYNRCYILRPTNEVEWGGQESVAFAEFVHYRTLKVGADFVKELGQINSFINLKVIIN